MDGPAAEPAPPQVDPTKSDDDGLPAPAPSLPHSQLTAEELAAKAIVPIKKEFMCPPPTRDAAAPATDSTEAPPQSSSLVVEKKSKRQLKRERLEERKSALHLCPRVAKSGEVGACVYGEKCRFSHDVEAYKELKPADLEGKCPFLEEYESPCPYGLSCRYARTHREGFADASVQMDISEVNGFSKDVQKLLWKNKMKYPKADATLKLLGLTDKMKKLLDKEDDSVIVNESNVSEKCNPNNEVKACSPDESSCLEESKPENLDATEEELRPVKKAKPSGEESDLLVEVNNGSCVHGVDSEKSSKISDLDSVPNADNDIMETDKSLKSHPREKRLIDFRDKLYLAPLTTVGNLPFRRLCKFLGADITCGEMAMCTNLLQGQASEWALLRRHSSEDFFGVQICGAYPDTVSKTVELIERECSVDFIDINMGCPIDLVCNKGAGSALLNRPLRMKSVIQAASGTVDTPITVKVRTGYFEGRNRIDSVIKDFENWGASAVTIHGRTRQQRYSKPADWDYISQCLEKAPDSLQVLGNGDVFSYEDWNKRKSDCPKLSACMIARGALVKPWIFTEIKEQRHWDISSSERLDILKDYARFGLQHWGSDTKGVETTRHFLLEWLSYTFRYVPVGLLEVIPQKLNWRPPSYFGRNDLETMMASESAADWIRISELVLGKVPVGFTFSPKHKSNAYDKAENG